MSVTTAISIQCEMCGVVYPKIAGNIRQYFYYKFNRKFCVYCDPLQFPDFANQFAQKKFWIKKPIEKVKNAYVKINTGIVKIPKKIGENKLVCIGGCQSLESYNRLIQGCKEERIII